MINAILKGLMNFVISIVNVILSPIDALIETALPSLSDALSSIGDFFDLCGTYIGWGIDLLGIPSSLISFVILYYVFKLTVPLAVSAVKMAVRWYNALKL